MEIYFPHEKVRESQKEFIDKIKETIENKTNLIAHVPTGVGKSAAVLSVALSYALKNKLTIFFITPKHTQHKIAVETLKLMKEKHNLDFGVVDLIGKKWMCAQSGVTDMTTGEFYEYCKEQVKNKQCIFYENLRKEDKISVETRITLDELNSKILHVEELKEISKSRVLCPFEIACLVAKRASVIIADYHHILSPGIREHLLDRIKKDLSECVIIIDEAHNVPERCRELLSAQLSTTSLEYAKKEAESLGYKEISQCLESIKSIIESMAHKKFDNETKEALITKDEIIKEIEKVIDIDQLINDLYFIGEKAIEVKKRSSSTHIAGFLVNWQGPDESFSRIIKLNKSQKGKDFITINYNCLDPSLITKSLAFMSYSTICMSGTLTPLDMYKDLFGFETLTAELKNPFPDKNKLSIIVPETTTKFTARSQEMYKLIANYCASIVNEIPGNSVVFFPSYDLRNKISFYLETQCTKTVFTEVPNMTKIEKGEMLEKFKSYKKTGAVMFGVSSGSFGEGIDIEDNILKCVIIVGIPLEKQSIETQEIINYYDKKFGKGWDYGYIMPAIIKCLQNAGRCIRSETDKGVIIFLDQRYIWENYFKCFPKDSNLRITKEPINRIREFFNPKEEITN